MIPPANSMTDQPSPKRILLAESSDSLSRLFRDTLRRLASCQVVVCASGADAARQIESAPDIALLVTEAIMPDIDGINLLSRAYAKFPALKAIILTEYDLSDYMEYLGTARILPKPVLPDTLLQTALELLPGVAATAAGAAGASLGLDDLATTQSVPGGTRFAGLDDLATTQNMDRAPQPRGAALAAHPSASLGLDDLATTQNMPAAAAPKPAQPRVAAPRVVAAARPGHQPSPTSDVAKAVGRTLSAQSATPPPSVPRATTAPPASPAHLSVRSLAAVPRVANHAPAPKADPTPAPAPAATGIPSLLQSVQAAAGAPPPAFEPRAVPTLAQPTVHAGAPKVAEGASRSARIARGPMSAAVPDRVHVAQIRPGLTLGNYTLGDKLPDSEWGPSFRATQAGVNRQVELRFFSELGPFAQRDFISYFQRLAGRPHPNLPAIYEVSQFQGLTFAAAELWTSGTFGDFLASGARLDARTCASICEQAIAALLHIGGDPCRALTPSDIWISPTGVVKIGYLHPGVGMQTVPVSAQLAALGSMVRQASDPADPAGPALEEFLDRLLAGALPVEEARAAIDNLVVALAPEQHIEETVEHRAAEEAIVQTRESQKRNFVLIASIVGAMALITVGVLAIPLLTKNYTDFQTMVRVPAGEFVFGDNQKASLPEFYIDEHEVTIYQYGKFLRSLRRTGAAEFRHPETPKAKMSHQPLDWENILRAIKGGVPYFEGQAITYDSPIFNIDWFDACAYAKWAGKRLPTLEEWEKAARGTRGYLYVWGAQPDRKRANTGEDYYAGDHRKGGEFDGFKLWAPVNKVPLDISPFGARNMQGNVAEWTSSDGPAKMGEKTKFVAGGSCMGPLVPLNKHSAQYAVARHGSIGLRCVASKPPPSK